MRAGVQRFFEHLPRLLDVPAGMELPVYSRREYSKSVWDMEVRGTRGVVNLVLNFPDQESSLAGLVASSSPEALPCSCLCSRAMTDTADQVFWISGRAMHGASCVRSVPAREQYTSHYICL